MEIDRDFSNKISKNKAVDELAEKRRRKEKRIKIKDQIKSARG
jgi:hypothetical protein